MVVQQDMMTRQMVFWEIYAPLEHVSVHGAVMAFELAGDHLHPIAPAESVVKTHRLQRSGLIMEHALEGSRLACTGAINVCHLLFSNPGN